MAGFCSRAQTECEELSHAGGRVVACLVLSAIKVPLPVGQARWAGAGRWEVAPIFGIFCLDENQ